MSDAKRIVESETWRADVGDDPYPSVVIAGRHHVIHTGEREYRWADTPSTPDDFARARIASVAPEALRLLLEAEWAANELNTYEEAVGPECPWCRNTKEMGHSPRCEWVETMRKAGVLE